MWSNPEIGKIRKLENQETTDLVTFTAKMLNEKLHFLCSVIYTKDDPAMQHHQIGSSGYDDIFLTMFKK